MSMSPSNTKFGYGIGERGRLSAAYTVPECKFAEVGDGEPGILLLNNNFKFTAS